MRPGPRSAFARRRSTGNAKAWLPVPPIESLDPENLDVIMMIMIKE